MQGPSPFILVLSREWAFRSTPILPTLPTTGNVRSTCAYSRQAPSGCAIFLPEEVDQVSVEVDAPTRASHARRSYRHCDTRVLEHQNRAEPDMYGAPDSERPHCRGEPGSKLPPLRASGDTPKGRFCRKGSCPRPSIV